MMTIGHDSQLLCLYVPPPHSLQALMSTHLSRLQQDLFHELKKVCMKRCIAYWYCGVLVCVQNGSARSLCVALDCFAALFPRTRPAKCSSFAQGLLPVLVRLTGRTEEGVLETLQETVTKILPTMTPFVSISNIKVLMMKSWCYIFSTHLCCLCCVLDVDAEPSEPAAHWLSFLPPNGSHHFAQHYH